MKGHRVAIACLLLALLCVGVGSAGDNAYPDEKTITKIVYSGDTPIKTALISKTPVEKQKIIKTSLDGKLKIEKYPLEIATEIKILKYRCDDEKCWYWISASRGGKEVATNSPVLIINLFPYIVISDVYDEKSNEQTITLKEDPESAVSGILQGYVNSCQTGKATTGRKE